MENPASPIAFVEDPFDRAVDELDERALMPLAAARAHLRSVDAFTQPRWIGDKPGITCAYPPP